MGDIRDNICKNILFYRKKIGLTQGQLAEKIGVKTTSVSSWERGANAPDIELLYQLCKLFSISLDEMYGVSDTSEIITTHFDNNIYTAKEPASKINALTPRDEKDIQTILSNTEELLHQPGLMFEGKPASQESIDSILSAMQIGMEMAKKKNKELYTPKKYKKD